MLNLIKGSSHKVIVGKSKECLITCATLEAEEYMLTPLHLNFYQTTEKNEVIVESIAKDKMLLESLLFII